MQVNSSSESNKINIKTENNSNKTSRKEIRKALNTLLDVHEGLDGTTKKKKKRLIKKILNILLPQKEAKETSGTNAEKTDTIMTEPSITDPTKVDGTISPEESHCGNNTEVEQAQIKEPGDKSYQEVIRDLVEPGDDGMLGEKEMQTGLIKYSLYQYDQNTLDAFSQEYEESGDLEQALNAIVSQGLIPQEDVDWVKSYTASAAETNRELDSNKQVDVELSNDTRYDYDAIINWSEANLAHIIHGNVVP